MTRFDLRAYRQVLCSVAVATALTAGIAGRTSWVFAVEPAATDAVDTALFVAVDVSDSVDEKRYRLQMEGIARALEDDGVIGAITSGPQGAIVISLVAWADRADMVLPWQRIAGKDDALRVARLIRALPQTAGEYTCLARMMAIVRETMLDAIPAKANRIVVDVSGDGIDNCTEPSAVIAARDALVSAGATINGLPIIVAGENDVVGSGAYRAPGYGLKELGPDTGTTTLDVFFRDHVIGGAGAFLLAAEGYEDFGRAFRQKFLTEISVRGRSHVTQAPHAKWHMGK